MNNLWTKQMVVTVAVEPDDPSVCGKTGSYRSLQGLERFQKLCKRFGVRPTYLLTYSAAGESECIDFVHSNIGDAEFGAHLHPEEVPPIVENEIENHTLRASDVEPERLREKIVNLVERVTQVVGKKPTSYRAGFLDLTSDQVKIIADLGIKADSSLGRLEKLNKKYCFLKTPLLPYILDESDVCQQGASGTIEVPITSVFRHYFPIPFFKIFLRLPMRVQWILQKWRIVEILRFRPTVASAEELVAISKRTVQLGVPAVMVMHSNELIPGTSTTVPTMENSEEYFKRLEKLFEYTQSNKWRSRTLTEIAHQVRNNKENII